MNRIIRDKWLRWLLTVELADYEACVPIAELYRRRLDGDEPSPGEWVRAARAAAAEAALAAAEALAWVRMATALARICAEHGHDLALSDLHERVHASVTAPGHRLCMESWHTCETTHCRAGWTTVIHPLGRDLEELFGSRLAASAIYVASGAAEIPDWFANNEDALADIREKAGSR